MPKTIRCKFTCVAIRTTRGMEYSEETKRSEPVLLDTAEFSPVTSGSGENKEFFKWTPSGRLEVGTHRKGSFEVGKSYYIDISEAAE